MKGVMKAFMKALIKGPIVLPLLALVTACSDDSFVVVSVLTRSGNLEEVAQLRVHASNACAEHVLIYPKSPSRSLRLDPDRPVTLSVEFDSSRSGLATVEVEAVARGGTVLAYGTSRVPLNQHGIAPVLVKVVTGAVRPEHPQPCGTSDGLACDPSAPAEACGADRTCGVLCTADAPALAMCYVTGTGKPGSSCATNADCGPGSQCFTFTATGCNVMTCLKFCKDDPACGQTDAYCNVPISCGTTPSFSACSRPCDPTLSTNNGCAAGLACFVYAGDTTDCACPGLGAVGAACSQNSGCNGEQNCSGCGAGLSCVILPAATDAGSGAGVCRPLCRLSGSACPGGTTCHAFDNSSRKLYGFCQ
jgi:hypothetical protein